MRSARARFWLAAVAGTFALTSALIGITLAQPAKLAPKTLEERVIELESKVKLLELQLYQVRVSTSRTPKLGPQLVGQPQQP